MYYSKFMSRILPAILALMVIGLLILSIPYSVALAQRGWEIGKTIGLHARTCIREGPGFSYLAHTRVPEDNWAVMIIDGPRTADGHIWWDTSRKAAGDPSGGTGWVTQDQTDTDCNIPPVNILTVTQPSRNADQNFLYQVRSWWYQQSALIKWGTAILLLLALRFLWRQLGSIVIGLIGALFSTVIIWIVLDLTRSFWQVLWTNWARSVFGLDVPDLAVLLAVLPLMSWGISVLSRLLGGKS